MSWAGRAFAFCLALAVMFAAAAGYTSPSVQDQVVFLPVPLPTTTQTPYSPPQIVIQPIPQLPTLTPPPSPTPTPTPIQPKEDTNMVYFGLSGYPRTLAGTYSTDVIDDIITVMDNEGLNSYRMAIYWTESTVTAVNMALYYLTHCSHHLVLDLNHKYPQGTTTSGEWNTFQSRAITVAVALSAYADRVDLEIINERTDSDLASQVESIITALRSASWTGGVVANKWEQSWTSMAGVTDSEDKFISGMHFYFTRLSSGALSWSTAETQMQTGLSNGLTLYNTEIGADYNEYTQYDSGEVARVTEFMAWCNEHNVSCYVWMNRGLDNWLKYKQLGLEFPATEEEEPPPEEPPIPPPAPEYATVEATVRYGHGLVAAPGYPAAASFTASVPVGQNFSITAIPDVDYIVNYFLLNGVDKGSRNPLVIQSVTATTYVVYAYFLYYPQPTLYFTVVISAGTGGSCNPTGTQQSAVGTPVSVTATAGDGYTFSYWTRNSLVYSTSNPVEVSGVANETVTLTAVFEAVPDPPTPPTPTTYTVYVPTVTGGSTDHNGTNTVTAGTMLVVVASPAQNYAFKYWIFNGTIYMTSGAAGFTISGEAGSSYTLQPVFQAVPVPPPSDPYPLPSGDVGILAVNNQLLADVFNALPSNVQIDFSTVLERLRSAI